MSLKITVPHCRIINNQSRRYRLASICGVEFDTADKKNSNASIYHTLLRSADYMAIE